MKKKILFFLNLTFEILGNFKVAQWDKLQITNSTDNHLS